MYSIKLTYKGKVITIRCSYRLTLLSLKRAALDLLNREKGIFPYNILNGNIRRVVKLRKEDFVNHKDYLTFITQYSCIVDIFDILKEYCMNDVTITKLLINSY